MRCVLCGGALFRKIEEGMHCLQCGSITADGDPPSDRWSPFNNFTDLTSITREDSDALLDMLAAEGTARDRSMGR